LPHSQYVADVNPIRVPTGIKKLTCDESPYEIEGCGAEGIESREVASPVRMMRTAADRCETPQARADLGDSLVLAPAVGLRRLGPSRLAGAACRSPQTRQVPAAEGG